MLLFILSAPPLLPLPRFWKRQRLLSRRTQSLCSPRKQSDYVATPTDQDRLVGNETLVRYRRSTVFMVHLPGLACQSPYSLFCLSFHPGQPDCPRPPSKSRTTAELAIAVAEFACCGHTPWCSYTARWSLCRRSYCHPVSDPSGGCPSCPVCERIRRPC